MDVTELGIDTDVRPTQSENAKSPMAFTEFGIVTDAKLAHPQNA